MPSGRDYSDDEIARFEAEVARRRRTELPRVRDEEISAAAQRAAERQVEIERDVYHEELESEVERAAVETPREERIEALRTVPSQILILLVLLLILALIISITAPGGLRGMFHIGTGASGQPTSGALKPILGGNTPGGKGTAGAGLPGDPNAGGIDAPNSVVGPGGATVDPRFWSAFNVGGGVTTCGLPLSKLLTVNGRQIQWFERCRLEYWPEYAGTPNEVQRGLVGTEYTNGRQFPTQEFFTSRPGLRYFRETSHAVGEPFLSYWEQHGDLAILGFPISEAIQEELADGKVHTVQYFQRARLEQHPEDPDHPVQLGLLGRALFLHEAAPRIIQPLQPTPVPVQ